MDRDQVEDIVNAKIAEALHPINLANSETRERLIMIDGNGTGRQGVLQRQDTKLVEIEGKVDALHGDVATLVQRSNSWNKKNVWEFARWVIGGAGTLGLMLLSLYISHKLGLK